jgi:hypothetical protein
LFLNVVCKIKENLCLDIVELKRKKLIAICKIVRKDIKTFKTQVENSAKERIFIPKIKIRKKSKEKFYGRCCNCGAWTSDTRDRRKVKELSNGAVLDGKWYCDLCLSDELQTIFNNTVQENLLMKYI